MIEQARREKNLPDELKYIAVIESSLLPDAESHQGASGVWQFMKGTGELYGLKIDKHIDERKDLVKSTDKALDYLKLLHEAYGNWTLALAAYNCGTGTINKAIKKAGGETDYWKITEFLPKETQKYIPRFIAASYLMSYYYLHDLTPAEPSDDLKYIVSVKVFEKTEFKKLSKELEIDIDLIRFLNPMYRKDVIPGSEEGNYILTLPDVKMFAYIDKYNAASNIVSNPIAFVRRPEPAEVVTEVRKNVSVEYIKELHKTQLAVRDNLKDSSLLARLGEDMTLENQQLKLYKMRKKESLADVAEAHRIPLADLMTINKVNEEKGLAPGSIIYLSK
ncbi:MAG: transglycosylase SLT domain-containing protein [Saprospiraceae bacterium]|nr:transglycosylase SLT domain-containing protein [Saprospiraceae bacterium]